MVFVTILKAGLKQQGSFARSTTNTVILPKPMIRLIALFAGLFLVGGCHMNAPMHVWKTPQLATRSALCVAVAPVGGPNEIGDKLNQSLLATRPQTMPQLAVLYPDQLEKISGIQLVSYDGQPSEMAAFGAAKRSGAQFVLSGEILQHDLKPKELPKKPTLLSFLKRKPPPESMSVRWTLFDAQTGSRIGQHTIDMDSKRAVEDFPDLAYESSPELQVIAASARRSWEMVVPTTTATQTTLDLPWLMPGSARVRKGNAYARLGQWEQAEREWQEAADVHPWNRAAWHNLSMAAVAKEDFQLARDRLKHADPQWLPGNQTAESSAWIDSVENQYKACFDPTNTPANNQMLFGNPSRIPTRASTLAPNLGAPPRMPPSAPFEPMPTDDPSSEQPSNPSTQTSAKPRSLDEQPWYTMIPFLPPPGWSWSNWWYQSTLY